ncbi:Hypothetical protein FKW44_015624, partial [Caligus rogercresseyi]
MSIINISFEEVKESKAVSKNKYELLQYAKKTSRHMIGLENARRIQPVYSWEGQDQEEEELEGLSVKANN